MGCAIGHKGSFAFFFVCLIFFAGIYVIILTEEELGYKYIT